MFRLEVCDHQPNSQTFKDIHFQVIYRRSM